MVSSSLRKQMIRCLLSSVSYVSHLLHLQPFSPSFLLLSLTNCPSSCPSLSQIKWPLGFLSSASCHYVTLLPFIKNLWTSCVSVVPPHLSSHSLIGSNPSGLCPSHSIEIIFVKVTSDVHVVTSEGHPLSLTTFNTVDQSRLLSWFPWHHGSQGRVFCSQSALLVGFSPICALNLSQAHFCLPSLPPSISNLTHSQGFKYHLYPDEPEINLLSQCFLWMIQRFL